MHLTIKERVELVLMSGADGATNRSVAKKFNRIYHILLLHNLAGAVFLLG